MNKTPVSILQEEMMKKKVVPNYELIYDGGGTHDNTFIYQVSCDGLVARGTGRCKKDAKHEAAKAMLEEIAAHRAYPQLPASPALSPAKKPSTTEETYPKKSPNKPFLNAIGALAQLCCDNRLEEPVYQEISDVGPPHARIFTVRCIVSTFKEEGVARTKKNAKHEAARKMLEKIQNVVEDLQSSGELDLRSEEARLQESLANEIALARYQTLTKLPQKKVNFGIKMEDYHRYLKKSFNEATRIEILNNLKDLEMHITEAGSTVTEEFVNELRGKIMDFLKPLNMFYCKRILETKHCESEYCVLVEISANPDICEIDIAESEHQAEMNGIKKIIHDILTLLS